MSDILKTFWSKLYAWALPSALAIGFYWIFLFPITDWPLLLKTSDESNRAAIFGAGTVTIAFCLNSISDLLYRILEGYILWPKFIQRRKIKRQKSRLRSLKQLAKIDPNDSTKSLQRALAVERLMYYPLREKHIAPTRFGNALRAFETYGKTRFNLDSQTLWYELNAAVPKYVQSAIDDARSTVDFFVASFWLSLILCLLTSAVAIREALPWNGVFPWQIVIMAVVALAIAVLCHWMLVRVTRNWSLAVQAMVNVGRKKLAGSLGLRLPDVLEDERRMWGLVGRYTFHGKMEDGIALNEFRAHDTPRARADGMHGLNAAHENGNEDEGEDEEDDEGEDEERDVDTISNGDHEQDGIRV